MIFIFIWCLVSLSNKSVFLSSGLYSLVILDGQFSNKINNLIPHEGKNKSPNEHITSKG